MVNAEKWALLVLLLCAVGTVAAECEAVHHEDLNDAVLWYVLTLCLLGTLLWLLMNVDAYDTGIIDTDWEAFHDYTMEVRE